MTDEKHMAELESRHPRYATLTPDGTLYLWFSERSARAALGPEDKLFIRTVGDGLIYSKGE